MLGKGDSVNRQLSPKKIISQNQLSEGTIQNAQVKIKRVTTKFCLAVN